MPTFGDQLLRQLAMRSPTGETSLDPEHYKCNTAGGGAQLIMVWTAHFLTQRLQGGNSFRRGYTHASHSCSKNGLDTIDQWFIHTFQIPENYFAQHIGLEMLCVTSECNWPAQELPPKGFGLISLPQTARRLFVITTPDHETLARCPRYC